MSNQNFELFIEEMLDKIQKTEPISSRDIPNIELYMDQVTTFMDDNLGLFKRKKDEKILTKTMINNYSKAKLLPKTKKKRYSKEHMVLMLFIYYFKNVLSIPDIKIVLNQLQETVFLDESDLSIGELLDKMMYSQSKNFDIFGEHVKATVKESKEIFSDISDEAKKEKLQLFSTIYFLSIQSSTFRHLANSLIDEYLEK